MSRAFAVASGALLLLAACATNAPEDVEPATPPPLATPATPAAAAPVASLGTAPRDACGAAELQSLIGRPRSEIPVPLHPDRQRVACTTCPITQDYNPGRLNFFFDAQTGLIREIRCG